MPILQKIVTWIILLFTKKFKIKNLNLAKLERNEFEKNDRCKLYYYYVII